MLYSKLKSTKTTLMENRFQSCVLFRRKARFHTSIGKGIRGGNGEDRQPELRKRAVDTGSRTDGGLHGAEVATVRAQAWAANVRSVDTPPRKKNLKGSGR